MSNRNKPIRSEFRDLTRYAVVVPGPFTATGYPEVIQRTVFKKDATKALKSFGGRHSGLVVAKVNKNGTIEW